MDAPLSENPMGGLVVRQVLRALELQDKRWDALAIRAFARDFAAHYGRDFDDVLSVILGLPDNLLECARNPQGVTALGFAVASELASDQPAFMATIH